MQQWLDRFCYRHPKLSIPGLMKYVVIGNVLIYLLDMFSMNGVGLASALLRFDAASILHGQVWRLVTFVFVPYGSQNIFFLAITLYFYYFIGTALEREWGAGKFTVFYLFGILLNILVGFLVGSASMYYVNMSMFFAFATLYPDLQFLLFFLIPVKAKWLAWFDAAYFAVVILRTLLSGHILLALLPVVAIFNYVLFFSADIADRIGYIKRRTGYQAKARRSRPAGGAKTINFHDAQQHVKQKQGYLHKCAVCGKTDVTDPDMEFRYCSKCNGYYCYCADHINNHVHVK